MERRHSLRSSLTFRTNASGKVLMALPVAARALMMSDFRRKSQHAHIFVHARTEVARERRNCVRHAKSLQKVQFRAPRGAAPLKPIVSDFDAEMDANSAPPVARPR